MVVSMRPYRLDGVERVREVTRPYGATHGEPVVWGWDGAERLGIRDIELPDWGKAQVSEEGEVPVFWVSVHYLGLVARIWVEDAG